MCLVFMKILSIYMFYLLPSVLCWQPKNVIGTEKSDIDHVFSTELNQLLDLFLEEWTLPDSEDEFGQVGTSETSELEQLDGFSELGFGKIEVYNKLEFGEVQEHNDLDGVGQYFKNNADENEDHKDASFDNVTVENIDKLGNKVLTTSYKITNSSFPSRGQVLTYPPSKQGRGRKVSERSKKGPPQPSIKQGQGHKVSKRSKKGPPQPSIKQGQGHKVSKRSKKGPPQLYLKQQPLKKCMGSGSSSVFSGGSSLDYMSLLVTISTLVLNINNNINNNNNNNNINTNNNQDNNNVQANINQNSANQLNLMPPVGRRKRFVNTLMSYLWTEPSLSKAANDDFHCPPMPSNDTLVAVQLMEKSLQLESNFLVLINHLV